MKIALLQHDVTTGQPFANAEKIIQAARHAARGGADLCVAPIKALFGPDLACICQRPDFAAIRDQVLDKLAKELAAAPPLLCGAPLNQPLLIQGGLTVAVPEIFLCQGARIGLIPELAGDPCRIADGADLYIDLQAIPFRPGLQGELENQLGSLAARTGAWHLRVNLSGGYNGAVYSGQSVAFRPDGMLAARAPAFAEDTLLVDLDTGAGEIAPLCASREEAIWRALVLGTRDFVAKAGMSRVFIGLSGGMDSALTACVALEALGAPNVTGVLMPSPYTSDASVADARALAENLGIATITLPIKPLMDAFAQTLTPVLDSFPQPTNDLTFENLQARIRGVLLMALANRAGALALNTGNKSELAMGYCTLYGDTAGALSVLGDLLKTEVYAVAHWYCDHKGKMIIPENIFSKEPSAELRPNQKDTDSLPPYAELDQALARLLTADYDFPVSEDLARIRQRTRASQFKREQCPPVLLVSGAPLNGCV